MRNVLISLLLLAMVLVVGAMAFAADDNPTSVITVKGSETSGGVVTVQITKDSKSYDLTCNEGMAACSALKKGTYKLAELPKNHGMYDCKDVRVFAESATDDDEKLGEYCMAAN